MDRAVPSLVWGGACVDAVVFVRCWLPSSVGDHAELEGTGQGQGGGNTGVSFWEWPKGDVRSAALSSVGGSCLPSHMGACSDQNSQHGLPSGGPSSELSG